MSCCHQVHNDFLSLNISSFLCSTVDKMWVWDSVFIYILDSVFIDWFMSLLLSFLCYFPFPRSEIQLIQNFMSNNLPDHVLRANQPLILALLSMFCHSPFQAVCCAALPSPPLSGCLSKNLHLLSAYFALPPPKASRLGFSHHCPPSPGTLLNDVTCHLSVAAKKTCSGVYNTELCVPMLLLLFTPRENKINLTHILHICRHSWLVQMLGSFIAWMCLTIYKFWMLMPPGLGITNYGVKHYDDTWHGGSSLEPEVTIFCWIGLFVSHAAFINCTVATHYCTYRCKKIKLRTYWK